MPICYPCPGSSWFKISINSILYVQYVERFSSANSKTHDQTWKLSPSGIILRWGQNAEWPGFETIAELRFPLEISASQSAFKFKTKSPGFRGQGTMSFTFDQTSTSVIHGSIVPTTRNSVYGPWVDLERSSSVLRCVSLVFSQYSVLWYTLVSRTVYCTEYTLSQVVLLYTMYGVLYECTHHSLMLPSPPQNELLIFVQRPRPKLLQLENSSLGLDGLERSSTVRNTFPQSFIFWPIGW